MSKLEKKPNQPKRRLSWIEILVIVAVVATLARLIYYAVHWRDLVSVAANLSWPQWGIVALFVVGIWWSGRHETKLD